MIATRWTFGILGLVWLGTSSALLAADPSRTVGEIRAGDECLVTAKAAPLKNGEKVLGYLLRGTAVRIREIEDGFALVSVDRGYLGRRGGNVVEPTLQDSTVKGYVDVSLLTRQVPGLPGKEKTASRKLNALYGLINSYNGCRRVNSPVEMDRGIHPATVVWTVLDEEAAKPYQETRAMLGTLIEKLKDTAEDREVSGAEKRAIKNLLKELEGVDAGLQLDRRISDISRDAYVAAMQAADNDRAAKLVVGLGLAAAQQYGEALAAGASALKEDPNLKNEETLLASKERARDAVRKVLAKQLEEVNVAAETVWQTRCEDRSKADGAFLVDCHEDAFFTEKNYYLDFLHDRVTVWNLYDRPLTHCVVKIVLHGKNDSINCYAYTDRWAPNAPMIVRPWEGYPTKFEKMIGKTTCDAIQKIGISVICDQSDDILTAGYEHTRKEKEWSAWQRLQDVVLKAEAEPFSGEVLTDQGIGLINVGTKVHVWLKESWTLHNMTLEVTVSDAKHTKSRTVEVKEWRVNTQLAYFTQEKDDRWEPTKITVKVTDDRYGVSATQEFDLASPP